MSSEVAAKTIASLLTAAWLLPLAGFIVEIFALRLWSRLSKAAAYLAVACIGTGFVLSASAFVIYRTQDWGTYGQPHAATASANVHQHEEALQHEKAAHAQPAHAKDAHAAPAHGGAAGHEHAAGDAHAHAHEHVARTPAFSGTHYVLAQFGQLKISIDYYIDSLTLLMFTMVTLIATCIHVFAIGYMSEELTETYEDHQVHTSHGHFARPGRFYRFFAFLSLFCFSMLGLVLAGNIFLVFVFWELVGVCSYFLIGFYVERKSASNAANKAFIMNRVGDFGFLIGLMILFTSFGTFQFATRTEAGVTTVGLFEMLRDDKGQMKVETTPEGVKQVVLNDGVTHDGDTQGGHTHETAAAHSHSKRTIPYTLLIVAGLGVFAGCVGKSAQFPLQTWLPDAMEGPTPVSALVHSATMVAAGVYLAGRFYPMFTPEVLLAISYIGAITLFLAATIAIVATDIKRVLAYSTISQLGYMMLAIGLGGWAAGLFHLVTHAFFKSLMFLCSGSVIYGCHHVQEMPQMGGLWRKMPITAFTMLVGVIAICGLAIPGTPIAFSGYHSKDAIVATAMTYAQLNPMHSLLFLLPLSGAGITAFYMFRLWFYTFAGKPRDQHVYEHAHESPWVMTAPLLILAVFAAFVAVGGEQGPLFTTILGSEPTGVADGLRVGTGGSRIALPSHEEVHANHAAAGGYALIAACAGTLIAFLFYGGSKFQLNASEVQSKFQGLYTFLVEKWQFDAMYDVLFVRPVHVVAAFCSAIDRVVFDGFLHATCRGALVVSKWDRLFDETIVDGLVNWVAGVTWGAGDTLKYLQTGRVRQYVMFIVFGLVVVGGLGMFWLLRLQA